MKRTGEDPMRRRLAMVFSILLSIIFAYIGYVLAAGGNATVSSAEARGSTMPAEPNVAFIGPSEFAGRGQLTEKELTDRGVAIFTDWRELRTLASELPLDAVLIDAEATTTAAEEDIEWLREEFREGVVVAGLGVDDDAFASQLGLKTFRSSGEADIPLGPMGYRLAQALVLGRADEVEGIWGLDWIARVLEDEEPTDNSVEDLLITSFGSGRGELATQQDLDLLFVRINSSIRDAYEMRADYLQQSETGEE
jgi:hypothetical protein